MFKGLGDLASLIKQAQQMQGRVGEIQDTLAKTRVQATSGGGMVRVEANGQQKILSCQIDDSLWDSRDKELLEELVVGAVNQALEKSRQAAKDEFSKLAGGIDLPGLGDALSKLGLGGPS